MEEYGLLGTLVHALKINTAILEIEVVTECPA